MLIRVKILGNDEIDLDHVVTMEKVVILISEVMEIYLIRTNIGLEVIVFVA